MQVSDVLYAGLWCLVGAWDGSLPGAAGSMARLQAPSHPECVRLRVHYRWMLNSGDYLGSDPNFAIDAEYNYNHAPCLVADNGWQTLIATNPQPDRTLGIGTSNHRAGREWEHFVKNQHFDRSDLASSQGMLNCFVFYNQQSAYVE